MQAHTHIHSVLHYALQITDNKPFHNLNRIWHFPDLQKYIKILVLAGNLNLIVIPQESHCKSATLSTQQYLQLTVANWLGILQN